MNPTTTLYFVRHGQTDFNRRRIVQGRGVDAPLNATGQAQARALARRFGGVRLDAVYTSSMCRAIETASHVIEERPGLPTHRLEDLDEMAWGIYEGRSPTPEIQEVFATFRARWASGCFDACVEGGESILDVQRRALRAVRHIVGREAGGCVLVVTHGRLLRVLLCSILEGYSLDEMQKMPHLNTAVNRITYRNDVFTADRLNCVMHLEELDYSL